MSHDPHYGHKTRFLRQMPRNGSAITGPFNVRPIRFGADDVIGIASVVILIVLALGFL